MMTLARLNETTHTTDAKAFIAWLDKRPSVAKNRQIGTATLCVLSALCVLRRVG